MVYGLGLDWIEQGLTLTKHIIDHIGDEFVQAGPQTNTNINANKSTVSTNGSTLQTVLSHAITNAKSLTN